MDSAVQTCTQLPEENLAITPLCLTFGEAPCPYEWGVISETNCDLSVAIMHESSRDPAKLCAPNGRLVPPPKFLKDSIPFVVGKDLSIDIEVHAKGVTDVYINDTMALTVYVEGSDNVKRLEQATLLSIHCAA